MSFIVDKDKHNHGKVWYGLNTSQIFEYAVSLMEQAYDSLNTFENDEATAQFEASQTIIEELLYEMRL